MLLLRQLKPLRLSTWRQRQSFADRIKNKYLLPGNYPFRPLHLIWRLGNRTANPLASGPVNINLKLLLEQMRSVSRSYDGKLSRLPLAIAGKSPIQALSSSSHNKVFEQGYRNQLKSTLGSNMIHNPSGPKQNYSMVGKNSPAALLPNLLQSYSGLNTDQRRESSLSQSQMNRIKKQNNQLWTSSHIKMTPPEKTGRKPISKHNLSGIRRLHFSLTIPVRKARSRQKLRRDGLVPGDGEMLSAPPVKKIALGQRVIIQASRKEQKSANDTVLRRWFRAQSKSGDTISPHIDSRTMLSMNQYRLITRSVAGVNRAYGLNIFSKLNDLMTGLPSDMGLEAKSSWPVKLNYAITSPDQAITANTSAASKTFPGQAGNRFSNHYVQRQKQVLRRRETDLYQAKQRPSLLLSRPLISAKTGLDLIKKQVSLLPVGLLMSKRTNLEQAKQAERSHNPAFSAAQSGSSDARIKVQNKTGTRQLNSYPVSQSIQISRYSMIGTSKGKLGKQLGTNLSYVKGKGIPYYFGVPGYDGGSQRSIALQYLHRGFIRDLSKQQSVNFRNVLAVNRSTRNIYLDGGRNSFYPASPLAAGPGARRVKLPWQNRVKTVGGNVRGYDNDAIFRTIRKYNNLNDDSITTTTAPPSTEAHPSPIGNYRCSRWSPIKVAGTTPYGDAPYAVNGTANVVDALFRSRLMLRRKPGFLYKLIREIGNPVQAAHRVNLASRTLGRNGIFDQLPERYLDGGDLTARSQILFATKKMLSPNHSEKFSYYKKAMAAVAENGPSLRAYHVPANSHLKELKILARNRVAAKSNSRMAGKLMLLMADYRNSSYSFLASGRPAMIMSQATAKNVNSNLAMPSRSQDINSGYGRAKPENSNLINGRTGMRWKKDNFYSFIYQKTLMAAIAGDGPGLSAYHATANSKAKELQIQARNRVAERSNSSMVGKLLPLVKKSNKLRDYGGYEDQKILPGGNSSSMVPFAQLISSSVGAINNRTNSFADVFRATLMGDSRKSSLSFLAADRPAMIMHQSAARSTNNSLAMPSRSREINSARERDKSGASNLINRSTGMRSTSAAVDGPSLFGHQAVAKLQVIKLQIRARNRAEGRTSSRVAGKVLPLVRNTNKPSKYRGYEDPKILFGGNSTSIVPFAQLIPSSVGVINSGTNSFSNVFRPALMADSRKSSLSFSAPGRLAMIMRKATAGSINNSLAVPKRSGDINSDRGRVNLEASSSVGAVNSGTNSFPNVFRPTLMADSGKSRLSYSAPGRLAMIMRKASAGSISNSLTVPKRSGDINSDRVRDNLVALSPANRNKGIRDFKLGLIMKNKLKSYREKQTKSGWLQKWFVNKKPGLLKTPNPRDNFIELASNWGSLRAGSKLPIYQRLSVKEPKQLLVSPMKILPFTQSTSSSREVSPNWQTIGQYITRSGKPSDRSLNSYMDQSRVSRIKTRAVIFNKKRSSQAPLDRNITGANKTLISGDKTRQPVNYSDPNLIPYRGIKTVDDKRIPSYSLLASGPDLNHRRDTSSAASNYLDSAIDTKAKAITKELKMQISETRNPEIKNTEIKRIADRVYQEIQQRMKLERQRRGL